MAKQLIETLSADFEPEKYHDEYRGQLLDLIERKAAGERLSPSRRSKTAARCSTSWLRSSRASNEPARAAKKRRVASSRG